MRYFTLAGVAAASLAAGAALAKLPPLSDEAKAKAAEAASKTAWADKVGLYKQCQVIDRVVAAYRASPAGKAASAAEATPPCVDPGPYVTQVTPQKDKPLEASEAHSPPGTATSPPSTKATSAELTGPRK
jgi:hypothetical protein